MLSQFFPDAGYKDIKVTIAEVPDVIRIRNDLLTPGEREKNLGYDLNYYSWSDMRCFKS